MKKVLGFIVLFFHMNFSMFLPQVAEKDFYDEYGMPQDDINNLIEFVYQTILGNHDDTPEDEDNDDGQNFQASKAIDYLDNQTVVATDPSYTEICSQDLSDYVSYIIPIVDLDITIPPPKA